MTLLRLTDASSCFHCTVHLSAEWPLKGGDEFRCLFECCSQPAPAALFVASRKLSRKKDAEHCGEEGLMARHVFGVWHACGHSALASPNSISARILPRTLPSFQFVSFVLLGGCLDLLSSWRSDRAHAQRACLSACLDLQLEERERGCVCWLQCLRIETTLFFAFLVYRSSHTSLGSRDKTRIASFEDGSHATAGRPVAHVLPCCDAVSTISTILERLEITAQFKHIYFLHIPLAGHLLDRIFSPEAIQRVHQHSSKHSCVDPAKLQHQHILLVL